MRSWTGAQPLTMTSSPTRAVEGPTVIVSHRRPRTHRRGFGAFSLIADLRLGRPQCTARDRRQTLHANFIRARCQRMDGHSAVACNQPCRLGNLERHLEFRGDSQRIWTPCSTKPPQPSQQRLAKVSRDDRALLRCPVRTTCSPGVTAFRTEKKAKCSQWEPVWSSSSAPSSASRSAFDKGLQRHHDRAAAKIGHAKTPREIAVQQLVHVVALVGSA